MAFKQVPTVTIWETLRLWAEGQPLITIDASVGCDRKTVRSYIELARTLGLNRADFVPERKEEVSLFKSPSEPRTPSYGVPDQGAVPRNGISLEEEFLAGGERSW